jgi:signal transduction histidine kinase
MVADGGATDHSMSEKLIQQDGFHVSAQVQSALSLSSMGLLVIGEDRTVLGANPAGLSLLSLPPDALGRDLLDVLPGIRGCFDQAPGDDEHEIVLELVSDTLKKVSVHVAPPDEQGRRFIVCREISARGTGQDLSGRTARLARLDNLMSRLSHEVRNPLASILAGLQALERSGSLSSDDLFILGLVIGEARAAIRIIERYSESARTRTCAVNRVPVDQFVRNCEAQLNDTALKRGVSLRVIPGPPDAWFMADERAMDRALRNLLQNSLDACESGGVIEAGWRVLTGQEKHTIFPHFLGEVVVLFGSDNGCGLPRNLSESAIFEPLVTTKAAAAGLGLPVARHIIESQGGVLSLYSPSSGGTTFEIFLPLAARMDCWEVMQAWRPHDGDADPCQTCDVRLGKTNEFCWAVHGRLAESGQQSTSNACAKCEFFRTFNLVSGFKPPIRR